jgi:predicted amidohydrolase YtcJ
VALDAIEAAQAKYPRADHRNTLQHCQMADEAQFRRMAKLGVCANLFSNHIFYWGDLHASKIIGPDRAKRMDAAGTALKHGVPFTVHTDAPITPMGPLFTAWCAVNRLTSGGEVLGAEECIPVEAALHAITLGAAYTLKMDGEIGSIESGKWADFAVLEEDPLVGPPESLKDIKVWGTVLGGRVFETTASTAG